MRKLRVGIAGYGTVGKRRKLCVDQNPHMKLIAVCDKNFVCNNSRKKDINHHTNYKSLLNEIKNHHTKFLQENLPAEAEIKEEPKTTLE